MQDQDKLPKFLIVRLVPHTESPQRTQAIQAEAVGLVRTYGGEVVITTYQNEIRRDNTTYLGKGKVEEISRWIKLKTVDVVVVNENLKTSQLFALKQRWEILNPGIVVWDRTDLILEIFEKHALTAEAKLQIKLAKIRHLGPELLGMGKTMSQQGAGIGTRGIGETNSEIRRRHWRKEIELIKAQLKKVKLIRKQQREFRRKQGLKTISIIGYTNAGKTALFNLLTKKTKLVKNAPFATLDSSVGSLYLPEWKGEVLVTDTIGFIQNLPTELIDSFQSTLMETIEANLVLIVVDGTDLEIAEKIETVRQVLKDLGIENKTQILVFNKIDRLKPEKLNALKAKYSQKNLHWVSALTGEGKDKLIKGIIKTLKKLK